MKKLIIPILIIQLIGTAYANPTSVVVKKGKLVPFDGLLLNVEAQAKILADKERQQEQCKLDKKYSTDIEKKKCEYIEKRIKIDLNAVTDKYKSITAIKDAHIAKLQKIALKDNTLSKTLWAGMGIVVGILLTIAVVAVSNKITRDN